MTVERIQRIDAVDKSMWPLENFRLHEKCDGSYEYGQPNEN